jgi:predicted nucleic acid-binding protein
MYLLDTNIISEGTKKTPDHNLLQWLNQVDYRQTYLSVLTLGEIRKGAEKIAEEGKKQRIIQWLESDLLKQFQERIIPIDNRVADKWGYLQHARSMPAIDSLIAATALVNNLKLVTRNTKDFQEILGLELINPWIAKQ